MTLQATGIDAWVTTTEEAMSMARRYFELSRILKTFAANLAANGQDKRWFGLVEDDVFFPSLSHLRDRLFSYNTDGQHYIGLPSERLDWEMGDDQEGFKTYGGGAVLLTRQTISVVPTLPCFEPRASGPAFTAKRWDQLLHDCLMLHSDIEMHVLPGFYNPKDDTYDQRIDSYETGQKPLLLRRYAQRHLLNINKAHLVTNVCGESCFMQRYLFDDNWVLVNGISISQYPDGVQVSRPLPPDSPDAPAASPSKRGKEAEAPAKPGAPTIPQRVVIDDELEGIDKASLTWTGRKNMWRLVDSALSKDRAVWQAYVKRANKKDPASDQRDSVIVLIWEHGKMNA
jgi:hypothetical protein